MDFVPTNMTKGWNLLHGAIRSPVAKLGDGSNRPQAKERRTTRCIVASINGTMWRAPPTATVDELEIEAEGPLVLFERELPGPVPWFSVTSLGLWVVIRDAR